MGAVSTYIENYEVPSLREQGLIIEFSNTCPFSNPASGAVSDIKWTVTSFQYRVNQKPKKTWSR